MQHDRTTRLDRPGAITFTVRANGDDAPVMFTADNYADAERVALERSSGWLGTALWSSRSGRVATFKDGTCTGWLDGSTWRNPRAPR